MRPSLIAAAALTVLAAEARAQVPECVTTTTTTTRCTGSAAPLAAPAPEAQAAPVAMPPVAAPVPPQYWAPPPPYLPPPVKTHTELRPRYGLLAAGASIFGASYLLNASIAYMAGEGTLAIPVFGPLILAGRVNEGRVDDGDRAFTMLMVFDALVQTTGVVLFIAGAATKKKVTVYDRVAIAPSFTPSGAGLAASFSF